MERRPALLRAMVLLDSYSVDLTQAMSDVLGHGKTANLRVALMLTLHQHPGITPTALAADLHRHATSVARDLSKLADDGIVRFTLDDRDRRVRHVSLTRRGSKQVQALLDAVADVFASGAPLVKEVVDVLEPSLLLADSPPRSLMDTMNAMARAGARFTEDMQAALDPFGLTATTDRYALLLIAERPNARPSTLVHELRLSSAAASEAITRLEVAGLVTRTPTDSGDRRQVHVTLTPEGRRVVSAALDVMERHARDLAAALGATAR